jgi:NOL1/NOP2/sun family putative RNA methylase
LREKLLQNSLYKIKFLSKKYGYPQWMIERYLQMLSDEIDDFLKASETPLPKSIRANTLKIESRKLVKKLGDKGFRLKPMEWVENGFWIIESPYSIGATEEYLKGYYFIQTGASMLPPILLNPNKNDVVLDMCAAPGGKTSHLAQIMGNKGVIISIEINKKRIISLRNNLSRCLVENTIILNMDANNFINFNLKVDKILLDAPCTGEGLIRDMPDRKYSRQMKDIYFCSNNQKELISNAIKTLKKNGTIIYSTCSLAPEENEEVINHVIKNHAVKILPLDIIGEPGLTAFNGKEYHNSVKNAKRIYPHKYDSIGFFISKLKKIEE